MLASGYTDAYEAGGGTKTPFRVVSLSFLMTVILTGALVVLSFIHRSMTWAVWGGLLVLIFSLARELPIWRLLRPVMPYLIWLGFYLIWGLIVSPGTNWTFAAKLAVTTTILAAGVAILTAESQYLRTFANLAQLTVIVNLVLWILMPWSSSVSSLILRIANQTDPEFSGFTRYGGLLGNANMLGYICLVATILSALAVPAIAWMGRLSCLPLLYLSASRKSSVLYLLILILYVVIVQRRNVKFWLMSAIVMISVAMALALSEGLKEKSRSAAENPAISRLMDLQEKETSEKGQITRVVLLNEWLSILREEPWFGYGLQSMEGTVYEEGHPGKVLIKGPYPLGTHNTYLGVWIEIGPVGFITFVLMLLYYVRSCFINGDTPITKWVLLSLMLVNLTFLFVSHSHLFCFEGMISFALLFLLPSSAGLQELGQSLTQNQA